MPCACLRKNDHTVWWVESCSTGFSNRCSKLNGASIWNRLHGIQGCGLPQKNVKLRHVLASVSGAAKASLTIIAQCAMLHHGVLKGHWPLFVAGAVYVHTSTLTRLGAVQKFQLVQKIGCQPWYQHRTIVRN